MCAFYSRPRSSMVELLICNQRVGGSNPSVGSIKMNGFATGQTHFDLKHSLFMVLRTPLFSSIQLLLDLTDTYLTTFCLTHSQVYNSLNLRSFIQVT